MDTSIIQFRTNFSSKVSNKVFYGEDGKENLSILKRLDSCFGSAEALNNFAQNELGLNQTDFDASQLTKDDLTNFKTAVMAKLAEAWAKDHGFPKSQTGICAFLRNMFMSFLCKCIISC
jgi:hypothetical protein